MNFWAKFGVLIASYALVGLFGWYVHGLYDAAHMQKETSQRLDKVNKGTEAIVKFNQSWDKADVKNDCSAVALPDAMRRLLR